MRMQRTLLGLVIVAAAGAAWAQVQGTLRWHAGTTSMGLQPATDARIPCGSYTLSCSAATTVPLYASERAPRTLSMQVSAEEQASALRMPRPQGLNVSLVGKAGIAPDLGIYGRVGTTFNRASPALAGSYPTDGGLSYGVGFSWDFARSASASMGLDSYDLRGNFGESRELRTSLGLQWRY